MKEVEYLESQIKGIREERGKLPTVFSDFQAGKEAEIRQIMEAAGIWQKVQSLRDSIKEMREKVQRRSDILGGQLEVLTAVLDKYHRVPVEEGTTMHGIDISKLDWETRLKVMNGDKRTIEALGGTMAALEPPATLAE